MQLILTDSEMNPGYCPEPMEYATATDMTDDSGHEEKVK